MLRPEGEGQYLVLGDTGNRTDPCDGQRHSYPANIDVQAGDVIGVYVVNTSNSPDVPSDWQGLLNTTGGTVNFTSGLVEPATGETVTLPLRATAAIDESATVVR